MRRAALLCGKLLSEIARGIVFLGRIDCGGGVCACVGRYFLSSSLIRTGASVHQLTRIFSSHTLIFTVASQPCLSKA